MANRYAVKTGSWSDTTVWDGGTLPGAGDVVRPNGYTVTINQDVTVSELRNNASSPASSGGSFVVSGTCDITANLTSGSTTPLFSVPLGATATVTGGISSGINNASVASIAGTAAITGNVTGGSSGGIGITVSGTAAITGNVTGGTAAGAYGVSLTSAGSVVVTGDVTGVIATAIYAPTAGMAVDVHGVITAGAAAAIVAVTGVVVRVAGTLAHGPGNIAPISAPAWMVKAGEQIDWVVKDDSASPATGANVHLSNYSTGTPVPADVRSGTTYGAGGSITGTLAVPAASSVAYGVPVDATTGTAALTPAGVWDHEIATGVAASARLLANATIDSTGAQIAAATTA